ncbi:MAG: hypothetical protein DRJ52_06875 [Thermoprotei archaeon]|nr:MAG: hypothetical protein DRJ52_06875 [Thermoprotei archaeon]RLF00650.1 MAG: hypothetical protein DRJ63_01800 [Thermoprotei archaeon]
MVKVIDAHAHLEELDDLESALKRAREAGVVAVVAVGSDYSSNKEILEISSSYTDYVYPALGLHPWELSQDYEKVLEQIEAHADSIVAIGEVGLDYRISTSRELQKKAFREVARLASKLDKTLIVHARDAWRDAFKIVAEENVSKAIFHWFSGPLDLLDELREKHYFISVTPAVLYQKKHIRAVERYPIELIVIESDAPVSYRGKVSEPADTLLSLKGLASLKKLSLEETAKTVFNNTVRLYGLRGLEYEED